MKAKKNYWEMNLEELREATKEFDKPWTGKGLPGKALTAVDREVHRQAAAYARKTNAGRPRKGLGALRVQVSMERGLLARADAYARIHGLSRAALLARSVELLLSSAA